MDLYISNELNSADKNYVRNKMIEFNLMHFPDDLKDRYQEVNLYLKNADGQIFGGLVSEICWNWMEVQYLFVDEHLRKLGYGKKLLYMAEKIAKEKSCEFIKLDTLSFQALDFYKKLGFEVYGEIQNAGRHIHYYLKKDIEVFVRCCPQFWKKEKWGSPPLLTIFVSHLRFNYPSVQTVNSTPHPFFYRTKMITLRPGRLLAENKKLLLNHPKIIHINIC